MSFRKKRECKLFIVIPVFSGIISWGIKETISMFHGSFSPMRIMTKYEDCPKYMQNQICSSENYNCDHLVVLCTFSILISDETINADKYCRQLHTENKKLRVMRHRLSNISRITMRLDLEDTKPCFLHSFPISAVFTIKLFVTLKPFYVFRQLTITLLAFGPLFYERKYWTISQLSNTPFKRFQYSWTDKWTYIFTEEI